MSNDRIDDATVRQVNNENGLNAPDYTSQPDGKAVLPTQDAESQPNAPAQAGRLTAVQPSGVNGENPATAGPAVHQELTSDVPRGEDGGINPSAPTAGTEGPSTNLGTDNPSKDRPGAEVAGRRANDKRDVA